MKRMLALFLAAILLLTCTPVLAESAAYAPQMAAKKQAIAALKETYGFTTDIFGLFTIYAEVGETESRVQFVPNEYLPADIIGTYEVLITGDQVNASWTHDHQDPALWQSDIMDSPCWGAKQLNSCRLRGSGSWLTEYLPQDYRPTPLPSVYGELTFVLVPADENDLPLQEALALADASLADVFNMPQEEINFLDHALEAELLHCSNGERLWRLTLADPERCFTILINTATGEVFDIMLTSGGNG